MQVVVDNTTETLTVCPECSTVLEGDRCTNIATCGTAAAQATDSHDHESASFTRTEMKQRAMVD